MANEVVYILQFCGEVIHPSRNLRTIVNEMTKECKRKGYRVFDQYATIRRRMLADNYYMLNVASGLFYKIVKREMLLKRKSKAQHYLKNNVRETEQG